MTLVAQAGIVLGSALLLVWFLDHPFSEEHGSITPIEMEHVLHSIEEESHGVELAPPCTETGDPLETGAPQEA